MLPSATGRFGEIEQMQEDIAKESIRPLIAKSKELRSVAMTATGNTDRSLSVNPNKQSGQKGAANFLVLSI